MTHPLSSTQLKCTICKKLKIDELFHKNSSPRCVKSRRGRCYVCKECSSQRYKDPSGRGKETSRKAKLKKKISDPVGFSISSRGTHLKAKYGIDHSEYERILQLQNGRCAICKTKNPGGRGLFHVDHDHITGKIRGLLCLMCNAGLGMFRDNYCFVFNASEYLARYLPE